MPLSRIHHLGLTVTDADAHDGLGVRLGLCEHAGSDRSRFDETRVGLDHLAFGLDGVDELDAWERRFRDCNVTYTPAAPASTIDGAYVLVLRDPDYIQLELFAER